MIATKAFRLEVLVSPPNGARVHGTTYSLMSFLCSPSPPEIRDKKIQLTNLAKNS